MIEKKEPLIQITDNGYYLTIDNYEKTKNSLPFSFWDNQFKNPDKKVTVTKIIKYSNFLRKLKLEKLNEKY